METEKIVKQIQDLHDTLTLFDQNGSLMELKEEYPKKIKKVANECEYHLRDLMESLILLLDTIEETL
jgi:hypothetical protein